MLVKIHISFNTSSVLSVSESNYTQVEKTLLAIVLAYSKFGAYLKGLVTIRSPHKALITALQLKERRERVNRLLSMLPPDAKYEIELILRSKEIERINCSDKPPEEIFYTDGACTSNVKPESRASWAILATMNSQLSQSGLVEKVRATNQTA